MLTSIHMWHLTFDKKNRKKEKVKFDNMKKHTNGIKRTTTSDVTDKKKNCVKCQINQMTH